MQDLFCFIDNILSLSNLMFVDYVDRIYPIELEIIKDITDTDRSDSYIDLHIQIDSNGQLKTTYYNKWDDFNVNSPFTCSNIPTIHFKSITVVIMT